MGFTISTIHLDFQQFLISLSPPLHFVTLKSEYYFPSNALLQQ
jgi:hypothetical protein